MGCEVPTMGGEQAPDDRPVVFLSCRLVVEAEERPVHMVGVGSGDGPEDVGQGPPWGLVSKVKEVLLGADGLQAERPLLAIVTG